MLTFLLKRIVSGVTVLITISFVTFILLFFSGPNIARHILGEFATPDQVVAKEQELGLDRPILIQFVDWAHSAVLGDLGVSWFTSQPVAQSLADRLPVTLTLITASIILIGILSTLLGIAAAVKRGWADRVIQIGAVIGAAIPDFVLAIILVTLFAIKLHLLPATSSIAPDSGAAAWFASMTLPVIALVVTGLASTAQQVRAAVIAQLEKDYVRTLRSRAVPEPVILFKHVLRSAAPAGLTVLSLRFIGLIGGVVIIEQIFALPGVGALAVESTTLGDTPLVMGVVLYTVVIVIVVNLLVDLANGWLNPKVRVS